MSTGRYLSGQKRCQSCECFIDPSKISEGTREYDRFLSLRCPCCNTKFRTKPRANKWKSIFNERMEIPQEVRILTLLERTNILYARVSIGLERIMPLYPKVIEYPSGVYGKHVS